MRKAKVINDLERSTLIEEASWKHKSRALWLREGDQCTVFFHRMANANRRYNFIKSLLVDGSLSTDQGESIVQFYNNLYDKLLG